MCFLEVSLSHQQRLCINIHTHEGQKRQTKRCRLASMVGVKEGFLPAPIVSITFTMNPTSCSQRCSLSYCFYCNHRYHEPYTSRKKKFCECCESFPATSKADIFHVFLTPITQRRAAGTHLYVRTSIDVRYSICLFIRLMIGMEKHELRLYLPVLHLRQEILIFSGSYEARACHSYRIKIKVLF